MMGLGKLKDDLEKYRKSLIWGKSDIIPLHAGRLSMELELKFVPEVLDSVNIGSRNGSGWSS